MTPLEEDPKDTLARYRRRSRRWYPRAHFGPRAERSYTVAEALYRAHPEAVLGLPQYPDVRPAKVTPSDEPSGG